MPVNAFLNYPVEDVTEHVGPVRLIQPDIAVMMIAQEAVYPERSRLSPYRARVGVQACIAGRDKMQIVQPDQGRES
jgi:hypothetical protein